MPGKFRVLWVGGVRPGLLDGLSVSGCTVESAPNAAMAFEHLRSVGADIILAGSDFHDEVQRISTDIPVMLLTEPVDTAQLRPRLQAALENRPRPAKPIAPWKQFLVGESRIHSFHRCDESLTH